jgi:dihydropyrimidinase
MIYRKQGRMADDGLLFEVLQAAAEAKALVAVHAENAAIAEWNTARLLGAGDRSPEAFPRSKPDYVEAEAISRALFLANIAGANLYVVHVSTRLGTQQVAASQARGQVAYAETCTQYLALNDSVFAQADGQRFVCSPPLRPAGDAEALWDGIREGTISVVSSDHCGFGTAAKDAGKDNFATIPNGLPGVGLRLPLLFTLGILGNRISLPTLVSLLSTNPARLFGLFPRKGSLMPGADADVVLVDPKSRRRVRTGELDTPVDWSPYEGLELGGWPVLTISRGEIVAEKGRCVATPGRGGFLKRAPFGEAGLCRPAC